MENISTDEQHVKWIFGNMFFTTCIVVISFIQVYIYYHNDFPAKNICLATFFIVAIGLFVTTKNIPLSLLTAIVFSNLVTNCSDVKLLSIKNEEKKEEKTEENGENVENGVMEEDFEKEKILTQKKVPKEEVMNEPENKKMKQKYLKGSNFTPYLLDNNKDAYPSLGPNSMKFQN
jgi:hypothetical protein